MLLEFWELITRILYITHIHSGANYISMDKKVNLLSDFLFNNEYDFYASRFVRGLV